MKAAQLIGVVEKAGGRFELFDRQPSLSWPQRLSMKQRRRAQKLDCQVRKNVYCVTAELRERAYGLWWEANLACHCPSQPYAHRAHTPKDIWRALLGEEQLWMEPTHELDKQFRQAMDFDDYPEDRKKAQTNRIS
jgi:hypothetical protein